MRAGFALPDILITGIGNGLVDVRCAPYVYRNPPLKFVTKAEESVTIESFLADLTSFLNNVVTRLRDEGIVDTTLSIRWDRIVGSAADQEELEFCKAAGALGVDPYSCEDQTADFIESAANVFDDEDNLEEFLAGTGPEAGPKALSWLQQAEADSEDSSLLPEIEESSRIVAFNRAPGEPYTIGYQSARKVRLHLGFTDTEPVGSVGALAERLGNRHFHAARNYSTTGLRGVSYVLPGKPRAIVSRCGHRQASLFLVTRTFGDAIHFGGPHRSPVTDQIGTYRQQLSRAFAAEFLAPAQPVVDMHRRGKSIAEIAENFGVYDMVIRHQIENAPNSLAA